jgi:excisionase family DNA binding protein
MKQELLLIDKESLREVINEVINKKQSKEVFASRHAHLPELLSIKECAEKLGRSEKTIARMAKSGELKAYVSKTGFKTIYKQSIIDLLWKVENQE